jgi:hypothetical protein
VWLGSRKKKMRWWFENSEKGWVDDWRAQRRKWLGNWRTQRRKWVGNWKAGEKEKEVMSVIEMF